MNDFCISPEEKKKDQEMNEHELTPGKPDLSVNDNVRFPVLNERGDVELKSQQDSALN